MLYFFYLFLMGWEILSQLSSIPIHIGILKINFCKQHQQTYGTFSHCGGLQSYIYVYIGTVTQPYTQFHISVERYAYNMDFY